MKRESKLINLFLTVRLMVAAVFFLLPIVLTVTNSLMSATAITANSGVIFEKTDTGGKKFILERVNLKLIPDMVSFSQYFTVLLKSPEYLLKFWNSMTLVVPIVVFQIGTALLAAYGFARFPGKLKAIVFFLYIIIMLMPYQVTLVPNYIVSDWLGILDSYWSIWLPGIFSPFSVYLLTKYMRRIPSSIIDAAKIDGAREWQIFTKVCVPLCKSAIAGIWSAQLQSWCLWITGTWWSSR